MARAHRHFIPGFIWHLTHRCHKQEFLLRFAHDRRRWRYWLFEARKRYGLCVLNYIVTSNHIHLLVRDQGRDEISCSMQLVAARAAQEFNQRKRRKGAFWEDRYHATAVESGEHLARCLIYIDLNMVRAGAVTHPGDWGQGGYREIQSPPLRYRIIDEAALCAALGLTEAEAMRRHHRDWVDDTLRSGSSVRDERWTRSLAFGSEDFVKQVQQQLGGRARSREVAIEVDLACLREPDSSYSAIFRPKNAPLSPKNSRKSTTS